MASSAEDPAWLNAVSSFRLVRGDSYKAFARVAGLSGPDGASKGGPVDTASSGGAMKNSLFEAFSKLLEFRRECASRMISVL